MVQSFHLHILSICIFHPYQWQPDKSIYYMVWSNTLSCQWGEYMTVDVPLHSHHTRYPHKHGAATILDGPCAPDSGLWRVPLGETAPGHALPPHTEHNVYEKSQSNTQLLIYMCVVSFLCKTLGSKLLKMGNLQHGQI
jgi:hypothetical protein